MISRVSMRQPKKWPNGANIFFEGAYKDVSMTEVNGQDE